MRPASMTSIGPNRTLPPASVTRAAAASASSVATYIDHAGGWPSCMIGPTPGDLLAPQGEHPVAAGLLDRAGGLRPPSRRGRRRRSPRRRRRGWRGRPSSARRARRRCVRSWRRWSQLAQERHDGLQEAVAVGRRGERVEVALGGRRVDEHRAPAGDLRAGDEAPGAAQDAAVGQVGLQRVERQVDAAAVPRAQLQVVASARCASARWRRRRRSRAWPGSTTRSRWRAPGRRSARGARSA